MITLSNTIEIKNISAGYEDKPVIENIQLEVPEGNIVSIIGLSGVGKTTLFNVVAGLLKPYKGTVLLNGEDITNKPGNISYMLQKDLLLPFRTVIDNIALPLIIKGIPKKIARQQVLPHLESFSLANKANCYPHELSGGMRQRVALLRTYLFSAKAALLDEPFSALDSITRSNIQAWYMEIMQKLKLTTILITHDIDEAILLSDRVYVLSGQPATLSYHIDVRLKRPRSNMDIEFLEIKKKLLHELKL